MNAAVKSSYYRGVFASFAVALVLWSINRFALASANPGGIALGLIAVLVLFTPLEVRVPALRPQGAAWLLGWAATMMGASFGAASATGNGLYLFAGFMLAIGYGVYALMKNIDDNVAPSRILVTTRLQAGAAFLLAST
jgi:hypothetical protein